MDGDPGDPVGGELHLAGVHARTNLQAEPSHRRDDRACGPHRARRAVEAREDTVARGVDDRAAVPRNDVVTSASWRASSSRHARSPTSTARSVEPTKSVKRTVASTRSWAGPRRAPVRNSSTSSSDLVCVDPGQVVVAGELHEAPAGDLSRRCSGPRATCESRSPVRWRTSAGTRTAGSTSRTSIELFTRIRSRAAPGLAAARPRAPHQRANASSACGASLPRSPSSPQVRSTSAAYADPFLARRRPGVVVVGILALGVGAVDDHRGRALGIRSREEDAHRSALGVAEERRPLDPLGVQDGAHVVHPGLEVGQATRPVRKAGAALVETDERREGREALEEVGRARLVPVQLEVGDEAGDEDDRAGHRRSPGRRC